MLVRVQLRHSRRLAHHIRVHGLCSFLLYNPAMECSKHLAYIPHLYIYKQLDTDDYGVLFWLNRWKHEHFVESWSESGCSAVYKGIVIVCQYHCFSAFYPAQSIQWTWLYLFTDYYARLLVFDNSWVNSREADHMFPYKLKIKIDWIRNFLWLLESH